MTSAAVRQAAQLLSKLLVEEVKLLYGVRDRVEELQVELCWMQVFLRDADQRQHHDELIRMWISQIQELAYEAEDIVEKYIHKVSRRGRDAFWKTLPRKLTCTLYNAVPLHEVGSSIDNLTLKISKLNKRLKTYGVRIENFNDSAYIARIREIRRTYSNTVDIDLIKREADVKELVGKLIDPRAESNLVGIVGMGGLGKTTLAREVYREKAIVDRFNHLVWIYVSPHPQRRSILEDTLRQLGQDRDSLSKKKDEDLSEDLKSRLTSNCLVVLDDVWSKDTRFLKQDFVASEAKILLTTRQDELDKMHPKVFNLKPQPLNDDQSWKLLCKKALVDEKDLSSIDPELQKSGKAMLLHCRGLPIAIIALGGILATKSKNVTEWKEVENNISSYLARHTGQEDENLGVQEVLELSYNELPLYLKPCFLYLGNFPERSEIPTSTLSQLWEAEGLIQEPSRRNEGKTKGVRTYDIGEQYLEELVKRCMVDVDELYENGAIKTCRLHDLMRDLCLKKSEEEKFLEVVTNDPEMASTYGGVESSRQVWMTHRVAIRVRDKISANSFLNSLQESSVQLRSLIMELPQDYDQVMKFGVWFSKMCKAFELLRVLRLEGGKIKKLPDEIGGCIHLRYLSFKLDHESKVPSVVWKLHYLQTLDLQHNGEGLTVPNKLWRLKWLAHLYLPHSYKAKKKLRFSQPRQVKTLVNIDLNDLHGEDMKNMTNLRTLSFKKKSGSLDSESLSLVFKSNIITSSLLENPISTLSIDAETINQNPHILSSSTDARIEILTIKGMINPSLGRIDFPRTVVSLELYDSKVQGDCITDLVIHGLKELHLKKNAIRGRKFVVSSVSFPELKKLTLELAGNSELSVVEGTLPTRCSFVISCPRSLEAKISIALQQLRHNRDFVRIIFY